ncbi:winged helix-turn-helix domain-containing protein [Aquisalimonas asiatica]|uniref:DNA-binding transcriptional activator of the SARP family n=1 Tax=Aquisalimonas asiatica TaxID=406100 RepID=A0A1H8UFM4_9GAMM|nr:winged helix-turn-helix domain-containing protein [Aquisalimonas asiatica]SEP01886.1 DNA-binding transcriptional activator of the SARP family [Aquisalimonas asiatica]
MPRMRVLHKDDQDPWLLPVTDDPAVRALWQARERAHTDPYGAAQTVEPLLPALAQRNDLSPWLAFTIAVTGRIHTLSRFDTLDPFIDFFETERPHLVAPPAITLEVDSCFFGALVFRRPDHPDLEEWASRCEEAFEADGPIFARLSAANYLLLHRIWCGHLMAADSLCSRMMALRERTDDVRSRLLCHSASAMIRRLFLDYDACHREIELGMQLADETGVHSWDSHLAMQAAFLGLSRGRVEEGRYWLDAMGPAAPPEYLLDRSGYHYTLAWLHSLEQRLPRAQEHAAEAVRLARQSGAVFPQAVTHMGLGQLYLDRGRVASGLYHIAQARRVGRRMRSAKPVQFMRGLLQAQVAFKLGMQRRGVKALRHALQVGSAEHYVNYPWWRRDIMAELCSEALKSGIETEYVQQLIRLRRLRPPADTAVAADWYWPLEIDVLGTPQVLLDGEPISLGPRMQALLVALACLGDRRAWVSREALADHLWPDSEGDRAQQTLDTALHRLRRQLGSDEAVIVTRPGAVALDPGLCRVDYWDLLDYVEAGHLDQAGVRELLHLGARLCGGADESHRLLLPVDSLRRRLVARVLDAASGEGVPVGTRQYWLESLVAMVPEDESAWQGLIRHYRHNRMEAAASDAEQRCRETLGAGAVAG